MIEHQEKEEPDCLPVDFKQDKVYELQPILQILAISAIILSIIMDLTYLKWRRVADFITYEQFSFQIIIAFFPSDQNNYFDMYAY